VLRPTPRHCCSAVVLRLDLIRISNLGYSWRRDSDGCAAVSLLLRPAGLRTSITTRASSATTSPSASPARSPPPTSPRFSPTRTSSPSSPRPPRRCARCSPRGHSRPPLRKRHLTRRRGDQSASVDRLCIQPNRSISPRGPEDQRTARGSSGPLVLWV
jgi:hypothetical protein